MDAPVTPVSIEATKSLLVAFAMTHGAALPEETRDQLTAAMGKVSDVDVLMQSMELLYAAKGDLTNPGRVIVVQIASFVLDNAFGWHGINDDNRGLRIRKAMLRDMGATPPEGLEWPDEEADPEARAEYLTAPPPTM